MKFLDDLAYKAGFIPESEALFRGFSHENREKIQKRVENLNNIEFLSDVNQSYREMSALKSDLGAALAEIDDLKSIISGNASRGNMGYAPATSMLAKLYPNPMAMYTFLQEVHPAAMRARRHSRTEFERDGFVIMADNKHSKRDIKRITRDLKDMGVIQLIPDMFDHLKSFSNVWSVQGRNALGGRSGEVQLLLPRRINPIYGKTDVDDIVGWEYQWNNKTYKFPLDEVDHIKTYSLGSNQVGCPMLRPVVVDMEADLYASAYTNTLWQKGGLIKAIVSMDTGEGGDPIANENTYLSFAKKLQEIFARQFAGIRGAGQLMFAPVKGVHNIINPKDLEGPYKETRERLAITIACLFGCPPEVVGYAMTSQYQNKAAIMDFAVLSIDNETYYVGSKVYDFITERYIEEVLGYEGIYLQASGNFNSISPFVFEALLKIAQSGTDFMTVNEFREKMLHWEPLDPSIGDKFIGSYLNEAMILTATKPAASGSKTYEEAMEDLMGPRHCKYNREGFRRYTLNDLR